MHGTFKGKDIVTHSNLELWSTESMDYLTLKTEMDQRNVKKWTL